VSIAPLPSTGHGADHIENTAPVLLAACLFERVYLAKVSYGSIAQCFEQIRHNIYICNINVSEEFEITENIYEECVYDYYKF
jgi:hypothetical protein